MATKSDSSFTTWALGAFTMISFALASWSLTNNLSGIEKDASLLQEIRLIQQDIRDIKENKRPEEKQDATLRKHWKLHSWARDEIYEIRKKNDMPTSKWPDFDP